MGFSQVDQHRPGKNSYSKIGLVRGQFGKEPMEEWLGFLRTAGFDGYEAAAWELDLARCDSDLGAKAYAHELVNQAKGSDLGIFTIAAHLQGQALGDEPSVKTLQFVGGQALKMYAQWRKAGNEPPRTDPFYVPDDVGQQIHLQAQADLVRTVRLARYVAQLQGRRAVVTGFVGSPAHRWRHWFGFPPLLERIGGYSIPNIHQVSWQLLLERFRPVFDACIEHRVKFALECHPSEFASGDIASADDFLSLVSSAEYESVVGFNLDASHMEWQGVSVIDFIREFPNNIFGVHIKGVQVVNGYTRNGRLGGHQPMGHLDNGWNFVTAGSGRDSVPLEAMLVELKRHGIDCALNIEWEDNDADSHAGALLALRRVREADLPPSGMKHDDALKVT